MHSKNQRRHGSPSSSSKAPLVPMKPKELASHGGAAAAAGGGGGGGGGAEGLPFRVPRDYPHSRFNKAPLAVYPPKGARTKACVSLPVVSLEKMTCFGRTEGGSHVKLSSSSAGTSSFHLSSSSPSSSSQLPASSLKSSLSSSSSSSSSHKPQVNGRGPATPRSATPPTAPDGRRSPSSRSPLDKRTAPSPSPSHSTSSSQDRRPSASPSPSSLDRRPSASPSPAVSLDRRASVPASALDRKLQNGSTKSVRHKRVSGRIFDPNKHCGVLDPETKRACTRSLTCKTHSLTARRAVPGRKKDFDILLAEHKGRAKEVVGAPKGDAQTGSQPSQSHDTTLSRAAAHCSNGKTTSTLRLRLANAHMHRSGGSVAAAMLSSVPDPVPSWQRAGGAAGVASSSSAAAATASTAGRGGAESRLSSDEGEPEAPEDPDKPTCHYSPRHPHPMSCCAFNSRLMGRGHYVFDRRWDKIRLVLHSMVEKHVNSQMWKKVPLATESLASSNSPSPSDFPSPGSGILSPPPPLFASPAAPPPPSLDGVSVVSYSTAFLHNHNGGGIFCIRDPDPPTPSSSSSSLSSSSSSSSSSSAKSSRTKPSKSPRAQSSEGPGAKRRKPSEGGGSSHRKNGNGYHPPLPPPPPPPPPPPTTTTAPIQASPNPALISNGTAALSVKSKGLGRIGQGNRDSSGRYSVSGGGGGSGGQVGTGLLGDHPLSSSHSPAPYGTAAVAGDSRKRKSSSAAATTRPGKVAKTSGLDSIFRKSSLSLLAPLPESPHNPHLRQSKVHH